MINVEVLAILFLATLIRSTFGFGEALVAVPLLAMLLPVEVAAPIASLISILVSAIVMLQDWRHAHLRSAGWLVVSSMAGIPLGLLMLKTWPEAAVKGVLGVVIVTFAVFSLMGGIRRELTTDRWAWVFGLAAGILGGAYGMNGPPLVMYGSLRRWSPERFRATLQGYFLPASMFGMAGYAVAGFWTRTVTFHLVRALPLVLIAVFAGRALNRRMDSGRFNVYVYVGLLVIGAVLAIQAILL